MKWTRILLLACAIPVHAEVITLDTLGVEAQQRSMWCWAAVSVMGIKSFQEQGDFHHLSQVQVVARREVGVVNSSQVNTDAIRDAIAAAEATCGDTDQCDVGEAPLLFDLDSNFPAAGFALSMKALSMDIKDRGHPVIIRWSYSTTSGNKPLGTHALIITGYDDNDDFNTSVNSSALKVRIFDPLPVGSSDLSKHEKWMPYQNYLKPFNHEGVRARPIHGRDQYRMRLLANDTPPDADKYPKVAVDSTAVPATQPGGFEPPQVLEPAIKQYMSHQVFLKRDGHPRKAVLVAGKAIPVVAFGAEDLVRSANHPESLLMQRTAAYVVPVLEGREVVDSFLLLKDANGRWAEGGYSNNEIASLASKIRQQHACAAPDAAEYYIVSIPEVAAYFVAHGFQQQAKLVSLDYDARGGFVPASKALVPAVRRAHEVVKQNYGKDPGNDRRPPSPRTSAQ
jgi:hypothetical protein